MPKDDTFVAVSDLRIAAGLLTRLPLRLDMETAARRGASCAWTFPLIGAGLGAFAGAVLLAFNAIGLPSGFSAGITLLVLTVVTGALHEDGLADCCDGFWGAWQPAERLRIMKDSHIGTYGVLALTGAFLLRWSALTSLSGTVDVLAGLVAVAAVSRAAMVGLWATTTSARPGGLADRVGQPRKSTAMLSSALAILVVWVVFGAAMAAALTITTLLAVLCIRAIVISKIGGYTGDTLGAMQQVSEVVALGTVLTVLQ